MEQERTSGSEISRVQVYRLVLNGSPVGGEAWQPLLVVQSHENDVALLDSAGAPWLEALLELRLNWRSLREVGSQYYEALWEENIADARRRCERPLEASLKAIEERGQATLRLLHERPTGGNADAPILHPIPQPPKATRVSPESLEPGYIPPRVGGRKPKCFFALFSAFIGVNLMKTGKVSAKDVRHHLEISPTFVRACGFTLPNPELGYLQSDIPSLRKLQQFDRIMTSHGLWTSTKVEIVRANLKARLIKTRGRDMAGDTTHLEANSAMEVVELPKAASSPAAQAQGTTPSGAPTPTEMPPVQSVEGEKVVSASTEESHAVTVAQPTPASEKPSEEPSLQGKPQRHRRAEARRARKQSRDDKRRRARAAYQARKANKRATGQLGAKEPKPVAAEPKKPDRKSQSRTVKKCHCAEKAKCPHPYELSDPGAGTVVKGAGKKRMIWAHKVSVLATVPEGIPLDVAVATDAASHDSTTLVPHLQRFFSTHLELKGQFGALDLDSGYEGQDKEKLKAIGGFTEVNINFNKHRRKPTTEGLGLGMKSLSPSGNLTCQAGHRMDFLGTRTSSKEYLYGPPTLETGQSACSSCPLRSACCHTDSKNGRWVTVPFSLLSHLDADNPPMSRRFRANMVRRNAIERAIKNLKIDLSSPRLDCRGNDAAQAHLDRALIAYHLLLRLPT
jgi:hypothetical protein